MCGWEEIKAIEKSPVAYVVPMEVFPESIPVDGDRRIN